MVIETLSYFDEFQEECQLHNDIKNKLKQLYEEQYERKRIKNKVLPQES
jgi:hypothetical protein